MKTNGRSKSQNIEDQRFAAYVPWDAGSAWNNNAPDLNDTIMHGINVARGISDEPAPDTPDPSTIPVFAQGGFVAMPGVMPKAGIAAAAAAAPAPMGYADGGSVDPALTGIASVMDPSSGAGDPSAGAPSGFDPNDPRMQAIGNAEDALGTVEDGSPMQPHHVQALQAFTNAFGPTALAHLHANVKAGLTMRPRKGRLIVGQGGAKSDGVPARVNNTNEAKLSTGEFVMPADAVHGAGNGDPALGAQRLQQLAAQLASMKPAGAAKTDMRSIFKAVQEERQHLWIAYDDADKIVAAAFVTHKAQYSKSAALVIDCVGGGHMRDWLHIASETFRNCARDMGCTGVEMYGRSGWVRVLKSCGWQQKLVVMEVSAAPAAGGA